MQFFEFGHLKLCDFFTNTNLHCMVA